MNGTPEPVGVAELEPRGQWILGRALTGAVALVLGLALVAAAAALDAYATQDRPWSGAMVLVHGGPPWDEAVPARVRQLTRTEVLASAARSGVDVGGLITEELASQIAQTQPDLADALKFDLAEHVVSLPLPEAGWDELLASGRPPEPGQPELVAGALCRFDTVRLDGVDFSVTGRFKRHVASFAFAYATPDAPETAVHFAGADPAWFDSEGLPRLSQQAGAQTGDVEQRLLLPYTPASKPVIGLTLLGLILVALGGGVLQCRLLRALQCVPSPFRPALAALGEAPRVLAITHVALYGTLFGAMAIMPFFPVFSMQLTHFFQHTFTEGPLRDVGEAYQSGNIFRAANATWTQNYLRVTVLFSVVPALFVLPVPLVLAIMALRFGLAGAALSPMWSGSASRFVYHAITMTLELEVYILIGFFALILLWRFIRIAVHPNPFKQFLQGFTILISGTLLAGLLLYIAALYEAVTLIAFG